MKGFLGTIKKTTTTLTIKTIKQKEILSGLTKINTPETNQDLRSPFKSEQPKLVYRRVTAQAI